MCNNQHRGHRKWYLTPLRHEKKNPHELCWWPPTPAQRQCASSAACRFLIIFPNELHFKRPKCAQNSTMVKMYMSCGKMACVTRTYTCIYCSFSDTEKTHLLFLKQLILITTNSIMNQLIRASMRFMTSSRILSYQYKTQVVFVSSSVINIQNHVRDISPHRLLTAFISAS